MKRCLILLSFLFASVTVNAQSASVADYEFLKAKVPSMTQDQAGLIMAECGKEGHKTAEACYPILKKHGNCIHFPKGTKFCPPL
ncbi:hypothetical protein [Legionella shakespearei]|uniref:Uncharacterized protein n=1 Tax=Legionella shakespearei DSM 23087 TaxID=1122169 RepID=A0A0W0YKS6_9GAMM|nr:hypothetical protein [Legionella shakespearei]KTD57474.1 hypothetical protein Lsha_2315 [Legionella shakespearei DSM 23087]